MLIDSLLFLARLTALLLVLINLAYLLYPGKQLSTEKMTEHRIEHSMLALAGIIALLVLLWV
ncbi:hypothetical protein [Rheinheimera sp.]|jgi:hypothetical protein|uniref:hypothetical protein n=1 Tax=Rheinheimera sp. TaxID=1869214 RepID=UPI002634D2FE|nr:hypothetical protein [Rheinheimera sp.]MCA1928366.1 hypothetical protein [Rheinheimera sp.]